jgi:hypothetical protein
VERQKDDQRTQDFGATLAVVLAGPAVVAVARGIEAWLQRYRDVEIEITTSDGTHVKARRVTVDTAGAIITEVLTAPKRPDR